MKFVGEYLNGKKWNGKIYNENNDIEYDLKDGNGIIEEIEENVFYLKNSIFFKGEYINGEKNGKGKLYYYNNHKLKFEGEYLNGKKMEMEENIMRMEI